MDFENPFDGIFSDSQCSIPEIIEVLDTNDDEAQLPFLPNPIEPIATTQGPSSERPDQLQHDELDFMPLSDWDQAKTYDENPRRYIRWTMRWNVKINRKRIVRDTVSDLVVAPSVYWPAFMEPEIQDLLQKQSQNKQIIPRDTDVVVSVTKYGQQSLQRSFKRTDLGWPVVEKQFHKWKQWLPAKQLLVDISLNFESRSESGTSSKKGKRSSATSRQLAVDAIRLEAEGQDGQYPNWKKVYEFMRCTDKFCNLGNYCWNDSSKQKHFPIGTFELDDLIEYVEKNGMLKSHDDVPESFRRQIYAAEEQKSSPKRARSGNIQGTPTQSPPTTAGVVADASVTSMASIRDIPGMKDDAVKDYVLFLRGQYRSEQYKAQFEKAGSLVLEKFFNLELIYKEQRPDFFTQHQVEEGPAKMFIDYIPEFAKRQKLNHSRSID